VSGIHQFVPMLHVGDAVGRHATALQGLLRDRGIESEIYVELEDPETSGRTRRAAAYPEQASPGDLLVYQLATASDLAGWLASRPEPLVVNYHNITPPELFAPWDDGLARHQVKARFELQALASRASLAVAVSEYNRAELVDACFSATAVVPPIVELPAPAPPRFAWVDHSRPRRRGARWLSVGRLAPNKAVEDTLAALLAYRLLHDPDAELVVVGKAAMPSYSAALHGYAADLSLAGAVRFAGKVDDQALAAAYAAADVLVVSSEHEGYCLPVVEAMAAGLPVVAYREGALHEVLGEAGVLLETKDPVVVADAIHRLQADDDWRERVVGAGHARLPALGLAGAGPRLVDLLVAARDGAAWPDAVSVSTPGTPTGARS